jgi:Arc/MetJ-type ribon-helix-helix transcriptional regulator
METITLKMEKRLLDDIDRSLAANRYSTRTEFIRDAIRSKLSTQEKEAALRRIDAMFGKGKPRTNLTDEQLREIAGRRILKEYGLE